jgi:hypothetical protein
MKKGIKFSAIKYYFLPELMWIIIPLTLVFFKIRISIEEFDGIDNVLNSVISINSIVIGLIGALIGIVSTTSNEVVKQLRKKNLWGSLKFVLANTLFLVFASTLFTLIYQVVGFRTTFLFLVWIIITTSMVVSVLQTLIMLFRISMN